MCLHNEKRSNDYKSLTFVQRCVWGASWAISEPIWNTGHAETRRRSTSVRRYTMSLTQHSSSADSHLWKCCCCCSVLTLMRNKLCTVNKMMFKNRVSSTMERNDNWPATHRKWRKRTSDYESDFEAWIPTCCSRLILTIALCRLVTEIFTCDIYRH